MRQGIWPSPNLSVGDMFSTWQAPCPFGSGKADDAEEMAGKIFGRAEEREHGGVRGGAFSFGHDVSPRLMPANGKAIWVVMGRRLMAALSILSALTKHFYDGFPATQKAFRRISPFSGAPKST